MTKVVLFNGPAKSGKDTMGAWLAEMYGPRVRHMKFAAALKNLTHELYGLHAIDTMYYEWEKDQPREEFQGLTPRQAYIKVSEEVIKPVYGKNWFGKIAARSMKEHTRPDGRDIWAVTDSGFIEETEPVMDVFDPRDVLLIRILRSDLSFAGDSRNYLPLNIVPLTVDFNVEPGQQTATRSHLKQLVDDWIDGRFLGRHAPLEWPRVAEAHVQEPLP